VNLRYNYPMLEKPDLPDELLLSCLKREFGVRGAQLVFLPLGADRNTAVYRLTGDNVVYFLKLRLGNFDETSVAIPSFLSGQGVTNVIAPQFTQAGRLWADLNAYKLILYPFVEGRDGYEIALSDQHWAAFGAAVKQIHSLILPPALRRLVRVEDYASHWRDVLREFLEQIEAQTFQDPLAQQCAAFLASRREPVLDLIARAERYAQALRTCSLERVLCHADLHAGNLLIDNSDRVYIVDWDNPILAPKERDLMYAGGGQFANRRSPSEEERLFYQGYGRTQTDPAALAYYRYARIIEDLAVECELIFLSDTSGADRARQLRYLMSNFLPGNTIDIARAAAQAARV
jgi:spectinomycin phosphotransferase